MMLIIVSMGAMADVKVLYGEKGTEKFEGKGGSIKIEQADSKDDKTKVTVYLTFIPDTDKGFVFDESSLEVYAVVSPRSASTRAPEISGDPLTLTKEKTDVPSAKRYSVKIDSNLGLWVKKANFAYKGDGSKGPTDGEGSPLGNDYSGTYYIANYNNNNYNPEVRTDNYYLCPSAVYYDFNGSPANQKPYLTTHKPDDSELGTNKPFSEQIAKWNIKFKETIDNIDYYYIKYVDPNDPDNDKYLVHNEKIISNEARIRYHLQTELDAEDDNNLFFFSKGYDNNGKRYDSFIHICSKAEKNRINGASLNPAKANTDYYTGQNVGGAESFKQGNTSLYCGGLIGHYNLQDKTGLWFLEDVVKNPVVSINQEGKAEISSSNTGTVTYYYTINGPIPSTTTGNVYDAENPIDITGVETIKAIAKVGDDVSNVVTYQVGNGSPYLIQNQQCTAYYMVPGYPTNGNTPINTSSVAGPKMEWYVRNAGTVNGLQYYYIVNKSATNSESNSYLIRDENNIYMHNSDEKLPTEDIYKFYFMLNTDGTYSIYPKGVMNKSFHKDQANGAFPQIVISTYFTYDQAKWNFVPSDDYVYVAPTDNTGTALRLSSESTVVTYYCIEGNSDKNIISNATASTEGTAKDKSWMLVEASSDNWQTYYYIVSAATGKYMHFTGSAVETSTLDNAIEMTDLPSSFSNDEEANPYQFVLARTIEANTYYIIPKTHYDSFVNNKFYCLTINGSNIKTQLNRASKNNTTEDANAKWSFAPSSSFCLNPVFSEEEGNISISCVTIASEIHYTTDGNEPDDSSPVFTDETELSADDQYLVKAIAMQKNDPTITSEVVTLFNRPDITLVDDTYTYSGSPKEVSISKVAITITDGETSAEHVVTPSTAYAIFSYENNTNAGTATVNLVDSDDSDLIFFAYISKDFTINPATLTIEVDDDLSKGYLEDDPELTYSVTGIAGDDDEAEVLTGSLSREEGEDAGDYAINQGTLSVVDPNYTIEIDLTDKVFTINPKSVGSDTTPAQGITIDIHKNDEGTYVATVKNGEHVMTEGEDNDYTLTITPPLNTPDTKYFTMVLSGSGHNYTGSFETLYVLVGFGTNDDINYSGTFVNCEHNYDFATPSGMEANIVTDVDVVSGIVSLESVDYIPKQVPVLLLSNAYATGFFVQERDGGTDVTDEKKTSNKFQTNIADREFGVAEIYLLYKGEFVLNAAGTLAAGKVYLPYTDPGDFHAPTRLSFIRKMSTGIDYIQISPPNPQLPSVWYTLDGRRLCGKPTKKGIYLHNGKKAVVK